MDGGVVVGGGGGGNINDGKAEDNGGGGGIFNTGLLLVTFVKLILCGGGGGLAVGRLLLSVDVDRLDVDNGVGDILDERYDDVLSDIGINLTISEDVKPK